MPSRKYFRRIIDRTLTEYGVSSREVGLLAICHHIRGAPEWLVITVIGVARDRRLKKKQGGFSLPHSLVTDTQTEARGGESWFGRQAPSSVACGSNAPHPPPPPPAQSHSAVGKHPGRRARGPRWEAAVPALQILPPVPLSPHFAPAHGVSGCPSCNASFLPAPGGPAPLWLCRNNIWGSSQGRRASALVFRLETKGVFSWAPGSEDEEGLRHVCPLSLGKRQ